MRGKFTAIIIFLIFGFLSLILKLTYNEMPPNLSRGQEREALVSYVGRDSFVSYGVVDLNHEGSFKVHIYGDADCNGGWLVTPMPRNSEAVHLFQRQTSLLYEHIGATSYLLEGRVYKDFPHTTLWLKQKANQLLYIFKQKGTTQKIVTAVRAYGACTTVNNSPITGGRT